MEPHATRSWTQEPLVHGVTIRLKKDSDMGGWSENLLLAVDELAGLRAREEVLGGGIGPAPAMEGSKTKDKKKKKKKEDSESDAKEKKRGKKKKLRVEGTKELKVVFGHTGLDPDLRTRRKIQKMVRKKIKKKKSSSSTGSGQSSEAEEGSKEDSLCSDGSVELFEETQRVRAISKHGPGCLAQSTIKEMQQQLLTTAGTLWSERTEAVPPIAVQYVRQHMMPKLSGGASREALSLSWILDALLLGKVALAADGAAQRLKSLDMIGGGSAWQIAQRIELLPAEKAALSSRTEAMSAVKESKEELRARQLSKGKERPKGEAGGSSSWKGSGRGGRDGGKGKGKRNEKEDAKKGKDSA